MRFSLIFEVLTPSRGSPSLSLLGNRDHWQRNQPSAEEFDAGSPVHLALDRLQSIDVAFDRTIAPSGDDGRFDRQDVPAQSIHKVLQRSDPVACARSIHRCKATLVRVFLLGMVGCRKSERKPNISGRITA